MAHIYGFFPLHFLLAFHLCLFSKVSTFLLFGNITDRLALLAFRSQITHDPFEVLTSWNDSNHLCEWEGITCAQRHQRVSILNLGSQGLVGQISPHIGNLSFLKIIDLTNNSLSGDIPEEIGRLIRLKVLEVANNSLQGKVPINISLCSNLLILELGYNHLIGKLPMELGSLPKLYYFSLWSNKLEGSIPPSFGNLTSLHHLDLATNSFGGGIPITLAKLQRLTFLSLSQNNFFGIFPPSLYNLSNLESLSFIENHLTGSLPNNIGFMLPFIKDFYIGRNQFHGPLPASLFNASKLQNIDISYNLFTEKISLNIGNLGDLLMLALSTNEFGSGKPGDFDFITPLTNCSNLQYFSIGHNHFGGTLPTSIANFSKHLQYLNFNGNNISGNIPNEIENLKSLYFLSLGHNLFSGTIPKSFRNMQNLQRLNLNSNNISGFVPSITRNMSGLYYLSLDDNFLEGSLSPILENPYLQELYLSYNYFSGSIPKEIGQSLLLRQLELTNNLLNGSIPLELGNLAHIVVFSISNNNVSGEIPKTITDCFSLQELYLDGNSLEGSLPSSLQNLLDLRAMDVSGNNLSGNISRGLEQLRALSFLNLSFNNLEGEVPMEGIFQNASAFSVIGNRNICGGISKLDLPKCPVQPSGKQGTNLPLKVILGVLVPLIMMALFLVMYFKKKSQPTASIEESYLDLWRVSYNDLHKATSGFSSENLIGTGRYGSVYKGVLREGNLIAVKVLNLREPGASKNFLAECEALRVARHRNLLKIHTVCSSVDFSGNDFKALVFEFMLNGDLHSLLHPCSDREDAPKSLNFPQRLNIAIDVASGLDYLHNQCEIPIVHCDLKSSNILVDDELTAHVADFGLSKFLPMANTTNTLNNTESSSISIRGTVGYIPPEYGAGGKVSAQGDVYSFGIVLLEMFTGKRPTDHIFKDGLNIHDFSRKMLPQRLMEIVDTRMLSEIHDESSNSTNQLKECFSLIMGIGIACSVDAITERLNIRDALKELHSIKRSFLSDMEA